MKEVLVNIVVTTTCDREKLMLPCLESISKFTEIPHRVICVCDDMKGVNRNPLMSLCVKTRFNSDLTWIKQQSLGIAGALNAGWYYAEMLNRFHQDTKYFCYLQDDTIVTEKGWLRRLIDLYEAAKDIYNIGFFSGHDAPEHKLITEIGTIDDMNKNVRLKESMRATNMIAETEFWRTMMPIPRLNPGGDERGFPTPGKYGKKGKGSNIDIWLTGCGSDSRFIEDAAGPNCAYRQGKKCLIVSGFVKHVGHKAESSTWGNENKEYD